MAVPSASVSSQLTVAEAELEAIVSAGAVNVTVGTRGSTSMVPDRLDLVIPFESVRRSAKR